jgi:hypothetical protein
MPLFPDVAYPYESVLPRLPTPAEWAAAYTASSCATAAWEDRGAPAGEEPRVEDFLPLETGGEGLVWPPVAD